MRSGSRRVLDQVWPAKRGGRLSMMLLLNSEPSRVDDRLEETVEFLIKEEETISQELKLNCG